MMALNTKKTKKRQFYSWREDDGPETEIQDNFIKKILKNNIKVIKPTVDYHT